MSHKGDIIRLHSINKYINDIDAIINNHGCVEKALNNMESQYALMLCIAQIGELLNKIKTPKMKSLLPIKDAVAFRNVIVHNYDHINIKFATRTLKESIPELKDKISSLIKEFESTIKDAQ
jgi:uncharacterized protein with HEPN domain